jgi:hypothetical protein
MATALHPTGAGLTGRLTAAVGGTAQAYTILYAGFVALPIIAGVDKFFNYLVVWEQYLAPLATDIVPVTATTFMMIVGVVEIAAGLLVAVRPQLGGYVVMLWLWAIIANLLLIPGYYDIALRDFGLSLGALALARMSAEFNPRPLGI